MTGLGAVAEAGKLCLPGQDTIDDVSRLRTTQGGIERQTELPVESSVRYERNLMHVDHYLQRDRRKINLGLNESSHQIPANIKNAAIDALNRLHEYPLGLESKVIEDLSEFYRVDPGCVAITHGLDEALDRMIELFPDMRYVTFEPTFLGYAARLRLNNVKHQVIRLDEQFSIPEEAWDRIDSSDFVILANPNNPTGTVFHQAVIDRLHRQCGKLFIDEAYLDYSQERTRLERLDEKTFVFKSLSKVFALAGQRLGFLFGDETHIAIVRNRQWFCNTSVLSLEIIQAILRDPFMGTHAAMVVYHREKLRSAALELGFNVRESSTNFILLQHSDSQNLMAFLDSHGICAADTAVFGLENHIRITIGTVAENDILLDTLRRYASKAGMSSVSKIA
jgi:histidinol-phosphate aminotransferase